MATSAAARAQSQNDTASGASGIAATKTMTAMASARRQLPGSRLRKVPPAGAGDRDSVVIGQCLWVAMAPSRAWRAICGNESRGRPAPDEPAPETSRSVLDPSRLLQELLLEGRDVVEGGLGVLLAGDGEVVLLLLLDQ